MFWTRLLCLIHTFNLDIGELTRTVDGSEAKLFFWDVIWIMYLCLDANFTKTKSFKCSLTHMLPVLKHVFIGQGRWYLAVIVNSSMSVALTLSFQGTLLSLDVWTLRREHNTSIGLQICLACY